MRRHLLPLMRRHDIDLWIILSRENAPDPLVELFGGYGVTGPDDLLPEYLSGPQTELWVIQ